MEVETLKREACAAVDAIKDDLVRLAREIHAHPELAFEEHRASSLLCDTLADSGLGVERGAYGLATAFATAFGREDAPCVALLAEYDALPEIGHACGHNLIAAASVGAALALYALDSRLPGKVRLLGTPAEERGGGKEIMARNGALEGVDAALTMHPAGVNLVSMPCIAISEVAVRYRGQAAHASAMPERGINALDALMIAYQSIAALRQHIRPSERIHGIVTDGGQAPNIVPERAAGRFFVRARNETELAALKTRVASCFHAGASATGAEVEIEWGAIDYRELRRNPPLERIFERNARTLGREFFPIEKLPASVAGSTDMGNVSQRVPSIHPMLAAAPPHCTIHNAEFAHHACSELGDRAALDGAKALAMTALDFFCDEDLRSEAREAFEGLEPTAAR